MTPPPLKLVFMGTPDFAVPSLLAIDECRHQIQRVITQPDRPRGRGRQMAASAVKKAALRLGYEVFQPADAKGAEFFDLCFQSNPDVLVVVAYGNILPEAIVSRPPLGAINVHASLLPRYRGAAPIQWAIINGDNETGVTIMRMDAGMDTGDILFSERTPIRPDDTAATLHDRLAPMGAKLIVHTLDQLAIGNCTPTPQDSDQATVAPLLKKQDGKIDWQQPATVIERLIRGLTPWPGAYTFLENQRLKIYQAAVVEPIAGATPPGTVAKGFADELRVATGDGELAILTLQGASGKRLPVAEYLRGHPIAPGAILT